MGWKNVGPAAQVPPENGLLTVAETTAQRRWTAEEQENHDSPGGQRPGGGKWSLHQPSGLCGRHDPRRRLEEARRRGRRGSIGSETPRQQSPCARNRAGGSWRTRPTRVLLEMEEAEGRLASEARHG